VDSLPRVFLPKHCKHISCPPYIPHPLSILFFLILLIRIYLFIWVQVL
jgi:hypothetical protein